jgi:hypothetical protein
MRPRSSVRASADAMTLPTSMELHAVGSAIQAGNPAMVPSGKSQYMYSPLGSLAVR